MYPKHEFEEKMNQLGRAQVPFLFITDFELNNFWIKPVQEIDPSEVMYWINGITNESTRIKKNVDLKSYPIEFDTYQKKFEKVHRELCYGNTFLTNLTVKTRIEIDCTPEELFSISHAPYKLWMKGKFVVFSPEIFIQVKDGKIYSYPMKGTIDSSVPEAAKKILADRKEEAEHVTIVDLIRNDLSQVATRVGVKRFRYIDKVKTMKGEILQVSSEIEGVLEKEYQNNLGTMLMKLLPAGSVSGAPKAKTREIISRAEEEPRGYYTGVFGYFDGAMLDSGVMIRFVEQQKGNFFFRSGGGITTQSNAADEYAEVLTKIYVPVN